MRSTALCTRPASRASSRCDLTVAEVPMGNKFGGLIILWCTLLGTALGGGLAASCSAAHPLPDPAFKADPNQPAEARPGTIDTALVIDGAVCGFVLGAGVGALARRRAMSGYTPSESLATAAPGTDVERFRAELRRQMVAQLDFARVSDADFPTMKESLRAELLNAAEYLAGQLPIQLNPVEQAAVVSQLVDEMLATYERNWQERAAMGRPKH